MSESQLHYQSQIPFIDYVPAELKETKGDNWRIVFYVRVPGKKGMKRFRRRVKPMSNKRERERYAKRICTKINEKLSQGWSPLVNEVSKSEFIPLLEALKRYKDQNSKLLKGGQIRPDTDRSYRSMVGMLETYIDHINCRDMLCTDFNRSFVTNYADYIFFKKKRTGRTVNNYISWCKTLGTFLEQRGYIPVNSIKNISTYAVSKKKREIIDGNTLRAIFKHTKTNDRGFYVLCTLIYLCLIRRTELAKLRVRMIDINNSIIRIPSEISKNKKTEVVTIPKKLIPFLVEHLQGASSNDFLFVGKTFSCGPKAVTPKQITSRWNKLRDVLKFKNEYQFYSLKDTGITNLFLQGVPSIKIRDQARHHDIKITESYTPRSYKKDEVLENTNLSI